MGEALNALVARLALPPDFRWIHEAACRSGVDLDFFYPTKGTATEPIRRRCAACPVRFECLAEELRFPAEEQYGWFGGHPSRERRQLRRQVEAAGRAAKSPIVPARDSLIEKIDEAVVYRVIRRAS